MAEVSSMAKKKQNFLKRWLKRKRLEKRRKKYLKQVVPASQFESFFKVVDQAIADVAKDFKDRDVFLERTGTEATHWINDLDELNVASFKCGVLYGLFQLAKLTKEESTKEEYVV